MNKREQRCTRVSVTLNANWLLVTCTLVTRNTAANIVTIRRGDNVARLNQTTNKLYEREIIIIKNWRGWWKNLTFFEIIFPRFAYPRVDGWCSLLLFHTTSRKRGFYRGSFRLKRIKPARIIFISSRERERERISIELEEDGGSGKWLDRGFVTKLPRWFYRGIRSAFVVSEREES